MRPYDRWRTHGRGPWGSPRPPRIQRENRVWTRSNTTPEAKENGRVELTISEWREVFWRYGGACHLCGEQISRDLDWPHPRSRSVDHLVPVSRGGSNDVDNLRPSHLACNLNRGSRVLDGHIRAQPRITRVPTQTLFDSVKNGVPIEVGGAL